MGHNPKTSVAARNGAIDSVTARLANGYQRFYSGTKPTDADTALAGNTLLAECRFGSPAFAPASGGVATANAVTSDASANADGDATFYRLFESDGVTAVQDGEVGTSDSDCVLNSTAIRQNAAVAVLSHSINMPA